MTLRMRKLLIITFCFWMAALTLQAQTVISLPQIEPPSEVKELTDQSVYSDDSVDAHMIWAPPGFKKDRQGAPVREQLFILEGKLRFTLDGRTTELGEGHWVILPADTPHTLEVPGERPVKLLAIQDKNK